jgi:predicted TIM-barrel fold metal-dependent hydrolase
MSGMSVLEIDQMHGIGDARDRVPQADGFRVPAGTVVVSADSHWLEAPDTWVERFPAHLKDRAPRMFFDGGWQMEIDGKLVIEAAQAAGFCTFECMPGINQAGARLADLAAEGVDREILFPQRTLALIRVADLEYREWCFRAYNQYIEEVCAEYPDRFSPVGVLKWWEPEATADALAELKDLGFKTVLVPIEPGKDRNGERIRYNDERMDPFWAAVEASGLPLCFHIGENTRAGGQGLVGIFVLEQMQGFRNLWGTLTFGGVFDRFPGLRVVFVEGQLNWVPGALQDADMIYEGFQSMVNPKLAHSPSWYWHNHCYATFMVDPAGLEMLHRIGPERALWSSDYPHNESTLGYTRSSVEAVFRATSEENARKIVGGNAIDLFGLS